MSKYILLFFLSVIAFIFNGCNVFDKEEPIPSYVRISAVGFQTEPNSLQGTSSSNITDAWVYVNDQLQGVYPLPTRFPILTSGKSNITIRAGIIENGIDATRIEYPFYNSWDSIVELKTKEILSIHPKIINYKPGTVFHLIEDFEGLGINFEKTSSSLNDIGKTSNSEIVFEGMNCGKFEILTGTTDVTVATIKLYDLPKQGNDVFLEMNYKINQNMEVGIMAQNGGQITQSSVLGLRATTTDSGTTQWKKTYINLTQAISSQPYASGFKVYFFAEKADSVDFPVFYIDNVKLISF
ncbi:MAG: hypothetical protein IT238_04990 [Bacteroidia bacterium]|nr:hypothetical protein [Bacteroidia bacterium]